MNKGDRIAIDTEFVTVEMAEAIVKTDGTRVVLKESRQALARVSVISTKENYQQVLIDDYILQTEPVVDYLTRFSGLTARDLDPSSSGNKRNLVSLKTVYLKLLYLVDIGCVFVGHGLRKDFRIINIHIPSSQVVDTVELYQQPMKRKIALRFLSALLIGGDIQGDTHDSIEDARAALLLHNKYLELKDLNLFNEKLQEIYTIGRKCRWQVALLRENQALSRGI